MSGIKFNHVFAGLLALSAASAFLINPRYTNRIRNVQALFAPVASPARRVAAAINERVARSEIRDHRALADIHWENESLRTRLMNITSQLEDQVRINAERSKLGDLRDLCIFVPVIGTDTGTSESISLRTTAADGIKDGMAVVYPHGLVGRVHRGGVAGAQVQLITDRSFRAKAWFQYFEKDPQGGLVSKSRPAAQVVAEGDGKGSIIVSSVGEQDAASVQIGDELVLDDPAWPKALMGRRIGKVISKTARRDAPLFSEIRMQPLRNLKELTEVMVVTRAQD